MKRLVLSLVTLFLTGLSSAPAARACAACAQTEDTHMADGARAGVIVMAVITYAVLSGFGGLTVFFMLRARRLRLSAAAADPLIDERSDRN